MSKRYLLQAIVLFILLSPGIAVPAPPDRIISLAPSITEILYALGLEDRIVGVTSFCDYPPRVKSKPKVGGMSNPSLESIVSLKPDVVVMTTDGNPEGFDRRLRRLGIKAYVFRARRLSELPKGIRALGRYLDVREKAESLAERIEHALEGYKRQSSSNRYPEGKAVFIIWPEPLIVAGPGTAIDDAIRLLGWRNIASPTRVRYPRYSIEEIIGQAPDVILIGKGHANMEEISRRLLRRLGMLKAVREGRVYYVSDALYRLGPRVIEGIRELSGYLKGNR